MFKKLIIIFALLFIAATSANAWVIVQDIGSNNELIDNNTDDMIDFAGRGGSDNTDIRFDLDGASPTISSPTDTTITIADILAVSGAFTTTGAITSGAAMMHSLEDVTCAADAGTAAVTATITTITTDGGADANEDTVSLADGTSGQIKIFIYKTETDAGDSANVTPTSALGFTKIVFDTPGEGATMVFDGTNWSIVSNNGGTIS